MIARLGYDRFIIKFTREEFSGKAKCTVNKYPAGAWYMEVMYTKYVGIKHLEKVYERIKWECEGSFELTELPDFLKPFNQLLFLL